MPSLYCKHNDNGDDYDDIGRYNHHPQPEYFLFPTWQLWWKLKLHISMSCGAKVSNWFTFYCNYIFSLSFSGNDMEEMVRLQFLDVFISLLFLCFLPNVFSVWSHGWSFRRQYFYKKFGWKQPNHVSTIISFSFNQQTNLSFE